VALVLGAGRLVVPVQRAGRQGVPVQAADLLVALVLGAGRLVVPVQRAGRQGVSVRRRYPGGFGPRLMTGSRCCR